MSLGVVRAACAADGKADAPFVVHTINAEAQFGACAVFDVSGDGRADIISGGFWYEAPSWRRHKLRDVEMIGNRYDDYSNLPMDVNGDGRMDLVSVNYRSKSLYWVEQPASSDLPWPKHVIDTPGPMETGRLADIDGDGRLDVLPNGVQFAAWWERTPRENSTDDKDVEWVRHDLPQEVAGHGIGIGDIDGDGRVDIVGPRGWARQPEDARRDRWSFLPEFQLDRDASVPILVIDVDGDGDRDIVWGRGHQVGVYWLEQRSGDVRQDASSDARRWIRHAIDTSISQVHALLTADLDGDGNTEVIAGKRFLGHDGRDLGEYDPLAIYAYQFDAERRTWRRTTIHEAGPAAFGLDPKAIDVDGDRDIDLVAADRCGLYWIENRMAQGPSKIANAPADASHNHAGSPSDDPYDDHSRLMVFRNDDGETHDVASPEHWGVRRQHILQGMMRAMGPLPASSSRAPLEPETLEEQDAGKYIRRRIRFTSEPGDVVPAYLLMPKTDTGNEAPAPRPAMLCLHQTIGIGKGEPAGLGGSPSLHYAHELAERGYVCLVPDYPSFGDYAYDFRTKGSHYGSGSMKAIWNNKRAVDLLESLPEVDHDRIGVIGHSLGGHNALFTAALDVRLKAAVTSCGFTAFHHYYGGKLAGWTSDRYMPRIRDIYENDPDRVPFDFYEVIGAIAPRGVFINAPISDSNFEVEGVRKVVAEAGGVYSLLGAPERLTVEYPESGHDFPAAVRQRAYEWLDRVFK